MLTQQKIKRLEMECNIYKQRLLEISQFNSIKPELDTYLRRNSIKNILEVPAHGSFSSTSTTSFDGVNKSEHTNGNSKQLLDFNDMNGSAPPVPPRHFENTPTVGTKLEGLLLNEIEQDDDFDPRSFENSTSHGFPGMNGNSTSPPPLCE